MIDGKKSSVLPILVLLAIPCLLFAGKPKGLNLSEIRIRDPYILPDKSNGTYYMYAQMDNRIGKKDKTKGVEVYTSRDLNTWQGPDPVFIVPKGFWADKAVWAPEVHRYKKKYYLFVTFTSKDPLPAIEGRPPQVKRGTQILHSESPKGPFKTFANRAHTPADWMALDGTLWIENDTPWMIFCHEWWQITDGTIELVKLKDDLSDVVGKSETLFSATAAGWVKSLKEIGGKNHGYITDGPFLYRTKTDKLLMIWSSFGQHRYTVGMVESKSGKITGPWLQVKKPLFAVNGGHGMIFKTFDDRLMLVIHQPNSGAKERARFFELEDTGDILRLKKK